MLRLASYDIVFQEVPGEVSLALNIAGCPNGCPGCHSPNLQRDDGEPLDGRLVETLLDTYRGSVTCVCFMGGDASPGEVASLAAAVRERSGGTLKTCWYSGRAELPAGVDTACFDFIKLGPYIEKLGGLRSPATNQRFYRNDNGGLTDITEVFRK